jgi:putative chitinase
MSDFAPALMRLWPSGDEKIPNLRAGMIASAPAVFAKYGITSPLLVAHVMAQGSLECGAGHEVIEDLSYSAGRAHEVWPNRFPTVADAEPYAHNPTALGNKVYGGRMGNRPGTNDGSDYLGKGFAQTTGRDEYERLGKMVGLDLVGHPELLLDPRYFLECGVANFVLCGCLPFAKADDVVGVTRRLNGGVNGLAQREAWLKKWKAELGSTPIVLAPAGSAVTPLPLSELRSHIPPPQGGREQPQLPSPAMPKRIPAPTPAPARPSITHPARGSVGAFIASILAAIFNRKG